ncbi:MAG: FAD-dependent oxidoreductase [Chloroflexota bacterium]
MTTQTNNILILGGGFAGVMAALRVAHKTKRLDTAIILINGLEHFVERPRLHEAATGTSLKARPIPQMLRGANVSFQQATVTAIDPAAQCVHIQATDGGQILPYDYVINALGSRVNRLSVPGIDDHAYTLDSAGDLTTAALRAKLNGYHGQPMRAVVIGGGATGVETATQLKGMIPDSDVAIVTQGKLGAFKGERIQKHIVAAFAEQAITVYEESQVIRVEQNAVILATQQIPADVIVWAGGFQASPIARAAGIRVNKQDQMLVDPNLRSLSHPNIFGAGDAIMTVEEPGAPMRMSVFTALVSGAQVGDNVAALVRGRSPKPLSYVWYGQGIALGPRDAVGFSTYPADVAWPLIFRRCMAVKVRNFFVWYLTAALEMERRMPGSFFWNGKGRYQKRLQQHRPSEATV